MATIARQEHDTPKSYAALLDYFALGVGRSLEKYRHATGRSPGFLRQLERWSAEHAWAARCQAADDMLALEASAAHTAAYIASLEAHRKRAQDAGEGVYIVAAKLLQRMNKELDTLEITPATLGVLLRAFQTALDLEAHSLGVDQILTSLEDRGSIE